MTRLVETVGWWAVLFGVWLLTQSTLSGAEFVLAAVLALVCAPSATLGRRAIGASWGVRARWLRWLPALPVSVLADTARIFLLALRHPAVGTEQGRIRRIELRPEADPRLALTQRALATVVLSLPPGSFVLDSESDVLVLHSLVDGAPRMDQVVARG